MTSPVSTLRWTPTGYELPTFPAINPRQAEEGGLEHARLVIVGGGLTGLTLAADLATRGVEAILLDDDNTVGVKGASSRGMVWARKSIEIMDRLGVARRMIEKGVTWSVGRTLSGEERSTVSTGRRTTPPRANRLSSICSSSILNGSSWSG